jgi:hypothetical protein
MLAPEFFFVNSLLPYAAWGQVGFGFSKRGFLEKEKVCLVGDRLVGEWLMVWKGATDLTQYLSFINFINKTNYYGGTLFDR